MLQIVLKERVSCFILAIGSFFLFSCSGPVPFIPGSAKLTSQAESLETGSETPNLMIDDFTAANETAKVRAELTTHVEQKESQVLENVLGGIRELSIDSEGISYTSVEINPKVLLGFFGARTYGPNKAIVKLTYKASEKKIFDFSRYTAIQLNGLTCTKDSELILTILGEEEKVLAEFKTELQNPNKAMDVKNLDYKLPKDSDSMKKVKALRLTFDLRKVPLSECLLDQIKFSENRG